LKDVHFSAVWKEMMETYGEKCLKTEKFLNGTSYLRRACDGILEHTKWSLSTSINNWMEYWKKYAYI
jgi:hypothetical protein